MNTTNGKTATNASKPSDAPQESDESQGATAVTPEALERAADAVCKQWNMHRPDVKRMLECALPELLAAQEARIIDLENAVTAQRHTMRDTQRQLMKQPASSAGGQEALDCIERIEQAIEFRVPHDIYGALHVELAELRAAIAAPVAAEAAPQAVGLAVPSGMLLIQRSDAECLVRDHERFSAGNSTAGGRLAARRVRSLLDSQQKESSDG